MAPVLSPPAPARPRRAASAISTIVPTRTPRDRGSRPTRGETVGEASSWPGPTPSAPRPALRSAVTAKRTCATTTPAANRPRRLGRYTDSAGRERDLIALPRQDGCVLVVDRDIPTLGDRRLVACIAPEEPPQSTAAVCAMYLSDPYKAARHVQAKDLHGVPSGDPQSVPCGYEELAGRSSHDGDDLYPVELTKRDRDGLTYVYRLEPADTGRPASRRETTVQLHWRRHVGGVSHSTPVSLREVVGELESYEPACEITHRACAACHDDPRVATSMLQGQLTRLRESAIVLNRGLREAVLQTARSRDLSMSEIALRCGRVKGAGKGACSGETSWLARRIGVLPESGTERMTPWVHSDVLGLIARSGLGMSPREVELA